MLDKINEWFNAFEAVFWFGVGVVALAKSLSSKNNTLVLLGCFLVVFGISDVIEIYTGAWWKPLWLLIAKIAILIGIIVCFVRWRRS